MPVPLRDNGSPGPTRRLIVFVHGFNSSTGTWLPLRSLLEADGAITAEFDLTFFDYETALGALPVVHRLPSLEETGASLASHLKAELAGPEGGARYIDMTLVGHSMGGLIIQSCLLNLLTPGGSAQVLDHIRQVILFATPNFGSSTLSGVRRVASLFLGNPQERALRVFSAESVRIHEAIRDRVIFARRRARDEYPIPCYCFSGRTDGIVGAESARGHFYDGEPLPGDHFGVHCPKTRDAPAYLRFIDAVRHPHGHPNVWEIERFSMSAKVSPAPPDSEIVAHHGAKQRTVAYDNVASITRQVEFSKNNRCREPYALKYGTRNGGWVVPRLSTPHITPPDKLRMYDDNGFDAYFEIEPKAGDTSRLDVTVYKGFDEGHRDYHMHLGRASCFRRVSFAVDLSDYRHAGWQIIEPTLYFHLTDPGDHSLCDQRALSNPDPPGVVDPAGIWKWDLEFVTEGVVDIVWDVRRPDARESEPAIRLAPGEHAVFGYGSLLSVASLERTLGRTYDGPFVLCTLDGWRRRWNVAMPNEVFVYREAERWVTPKRILYLNVEPALDASVNGIVFVVNDADLERFDAREWIYDRIDVGAALHGVTVSDGATWVYQGKSEYVLSRPASPHDAAIRRSYLDILQEGHRALGVDFARIYEATTDAIPRSLVVDDVRRDDV